MEGDSWEEEMRNSWRVGERRDLRISKAGRVEGSGARRWGETRGEGRG